MYTIDQSIPSVAMFNFKKWSCMRMLVRRAAVFYGTFLAVMFVLVNLIYGMQNVSRMYFATTWDEPVVVGITHGPTKSSPSTTSVPPKEYEFVIAHYNENLDWLKPFANSCHVYDKGHDSGFQPSFGINQWEELPNVGRESHTYLYHIIKNYENLANITIFLQGRILDEACCFDTPLKFLQNARKGIPCISRGRFVNWGKIKYSGKWEKSLPRGLMRRAKHSTVGQFYRAVFGRPHPKSVDFCLAGCFSAARECLQKHPQGFYQKLMSFVDDHENPEEGHYMERLWRTIVTC